MVKFIYQKSELLKQLLDRMATQKVSEFRLIDLY